MQSRSTHVLTADAFEFALTINVAAGRGQADFKDPYLRICNFRAQGGFDPPRVFPETKISTPSLGPRVFPELRQARLGAD